MNFTTNLTTVFLFEILTVVLLGAIFSCLAIYVIRENRSTERGRIAARANPMVSQEAKLLPETGFYYQKTGRLGSSRHMKVRLYSLEDYDRELGGKSEKSETFGAGGFIAALKAYGYYSDHWYEMPCERAISSLGLEAKDCEVDEDCRVLLLRKLPEGLPAKAREKLDQPEALRLFAPEGGPPRNVSPTRKGYGG